VRIASILPVRGGFGSVFVIIASSHRFLVGRTANEPVIDKSVDYRAFCLQTTTKRKIKIFAQWDKIDIKSII
jgi:hypothetical protein